MDTVSINAQGLLRSDILHDLDQRWKIEGGDWTIKRSENPASRGDGPIRSFIAVHGSPHLHVYGVENELRRVTFSVPEHVHGFNGILIKTQDELDQAFINAGEAVSQLTDGAIRLLEFRRIDFCHHILCNPAQLLHGLKGIRHPRIRKTGVRYQNNAIQLIGKAFALSMYCKSHQSRGKHGMPHDRQFSPEDNSLRIEVQARNKRAVRNLYGVDADTPVMLPLCLERLWQGYRSFLAELPGATVSADRFGLYPLLALCEQNDLCHPSGKACLDWWKEGKEPETIRKGLKQIRQVRLAADKVNLLDLIPENLPTEYIDVLKGGSIRRILVERPPGPTLPLPVPTVITAP